MWVQPRAGHLACKARPKARIRRAKRTVDRDSRRSGARGRVHAAMAVSSVRLKAVAVTEERFRPFGQLVRPTHDGKPFDAQDARLNLSQGTPRFYIMRLPRRGMSFDKITYHEKVTQCLGGLGENDWYMAVAKPTGSVESYPKEEDLVAFRVPPGVFLKMEEGTWHAGPLFDNADHMDFYNLELSDTNVVDHNTHAYSEHGTSYTIVEE